MDWQTTITIIQTAAAIIQGAAALVFMQSVRRDDRRRKEGKEGERRDGILKALLYEWSQTNPTIDPQIGRKPPELGGLLSERQIIAFNQRLREMGEPGSLPLHSPRPVVVIPVRIP